MSDFALCFLAGAASFGFGCIQGYLHGYGSACKKQTEWLREHAAIALSIRQEMQAFLLEREDYHR